MNEKFEKGLENLKSFSVTNVIDIIFNVQPDPMILCS